MEKATSHFDFLASSTENKKIIIKKDGVYLVYVQVLVTNSNNDRSLELQLNDIDIGEAYTSDGSNHKSSPSITDIRTLKRGDVLAVMCRANQSTIGNSPQATRFIITPL